MFLTGFDSQNDAAVSSSADTTHASSGAHGALAVALLLTSVALLASIPLLTAGVALLTAGITLLGAGVALLGAGVPLGLATGGAVALLLGSVSGHSCGLVCELGVCMFKRKRIRFFLRVTRLI